MKKPKPYNTVITGKVRNEPKVWEQNFVDNPVSVLTIIAREIIIPAAFSLEPNERIINERSIGTLSNRPSMSI